MINLVSKSEKEICPNCGNDVLIRKGKNKTKTGLKQVYLCCKCNKRFVLSKMKGRSFDPKIIIEAISLYDLGNTLEETSRIINKKFRVKIPRPTISSWLQENKEKCTYHKIKDEINEKFGVNPIYSKIFFNRGINYNYKFHKGKIGVLCKDFEMLVRYLNSFQFRFPSRIFEKENRCSQAMINIDINRFRKKSHMCDLAAFALKSVSDNRERHNAVEDFALINDAETIAVEVPIWFWERNIARETGGIGLCGHIDILQIRDGLIYILDFKPYAANENANKVASQIYFYALGLSFRTGIKLDNFRCAWFDDKDYFEFEPAKAKVKWHQ